MAREEMELLRKLRKIEGIEIAHGKHYKVYYHGRMITAIPVSPNGGRRWLKNAQSTLRKAGVPL